MNCFWIVSLRYWAQQCSLRLAQRLRCELLLNCIFEILSTTRPWGGTSRNLLWIAFELYLWDIEHNFAGGSCGPLWVVNCFWIVSLRYWAQPTADMTMRVFSCELLLNCIFEILSTTWRGRVKVRHQLWIAFELYLWDIEHNMTITSATI